MVIPSTRSTNSTNGKYESEVQRICLSINGYLDACHELQLNLRSCSQYQLERICANSAPEINLVLLLLDFV